MYLLREYDLSIGDYVYNIYIFLLYGIIIFTFTLIFYYTRNVNDRKKQPYIESSK